ncbi:MAG: hypothetical protein KIT44_00575 [Opitutaceae bacterium]|nr:hypothetical protein [Opitutaceae bacterium]
MTASLLIKQIKALPPREQAKVRRYVYGQHAPNPTTRKTVRDANAGRNLVRCKDTDELFAKLGV